MRPAPGPISSRASSRPSASRLESGSSSSSSSRLVQDAAADRESLPHPGRELGDPLVGAALHPDGGEQRVDPRLGRLAAQPVQAGVEAQVLAPAQVAVEQRLVAEEADPAARLPGLAAAARARAPAPRRRSAAAGWRGCAAGSSCRPRSGPARPASRPPPARGRPRPGPSVRRSRGAAPPRQQLVHIAACYALVLAAATSSHLSRGSSPSTKICPRFLLGSRASFMPSHVPIRHAAAASVR